MLTIVSVKITTKIFNFKYFLCISLTLSVICYINLQFCQKISPLHFQISDNFICMPITVSDFFHRNSSILSVIICNCQFYDTCLNKIFTSTRKYLYFPLQLCDNSIWMPIIVSECFFQKNLKFYQLSYVILNFIMLILDQNLQFYQKISPLPFSIIF